MKTTKEQRAELRARTPTSQQSMYQLYVRRAELHAVLDDLDEAEARAERLWKALEEGRLACEPFDDVKPRKWVTDYENLARFHQHACAALAETEKEKT